MSQKIRRALAVAAVAATLSLLWPAPSHAAALWEWQPADLAARVWSWLEDLGILPREATTSGARWEKEGSMLEPNGQPHSGGTSSTPPVSTTSDEGSLIEPNG
jgi:hypothetical protein